MISIGRDIIVGDEDHLTRIDPQGEISFVPNSYTDRLVSSLAADASNVYIGDGNGNGVIKLSSSGDVRSRYVVPVLRPGILAMDLTSDQCTMLYASGGSAIQRY